VYVHGSLLFERVISEQSSVVNSDAQSAMNNEQ